LPELLLVIAVVAILLLMLQPALHHPPTRAPRTQCINNLRQIGLGFRQWAIDHNSKYPMSVSTSERGTLEYAAMGQVFRHFQALSNELNTPIFLACPSDVRSYAKEFNVLGNANVSYFIGLDADEIYPSMFMTGDRNLTNGSLSPKGILVLKSNSIAGWTRKIHDRQGNVGLADGSVLTLSSWKLCEALTNTGVVTNRLAFPVD
jgi:prepilin-type processing-associated H-X9-DG protein